MGPAAVLAAQGAMSVAGNLLGRSDTKKRNAQQRQEGVLNRGFAHTQAQNSMAFARQERVHAQNYNTEMSNTAFQRGTADLKAAGLHPSLAAGGGGASSPSISGASGASGSGSQAAMQQPPVSIPDLFPMAMSLASLQNEEKRIKIQDKLANDSILSGKTGRALKDAQRSILKKGEPAAILGGKAADVITGTLEKINKEVKNPTLYKKLDFLSDPPIPTGDLR